MVDCDVCYVTFPNYPTKNSGRGLDRYAYELIRGTSQKSDMKVQFVAPRTNRADYVIRELETAVLLRLIDAKIYHATSEYGLASLLLARKRPIVVTIHDLLPRLFSRYSPLIYANQKLHLALAKYADEVIVTSNFYSSMLKQELNIPSHRIDTIRYGVDHQSFRSKAGRRRGETAQVLYLGGLNSLKGAKDLIEAFARLCVSHEAQLLIGGSGKYAGNLRDLADKTGISEKVSFLGFVGEEQLPDLYNSADVLVWPSYFGFGLSTLEAMSCGTPVIGANCLDSQEYLGEAGLLYPPGNVEKLFEALSILLSNQDSWTDWSGKALKWSENFSWRKMTDQVCSTYEKLDGNQYLH